MDVVKPMKAELEKMQEERKCMEARIIAAESALEEKKRMLSEYKVMVKLADDLLSVFMEESPDNSGEELDEETIKELVAEAMRDFTEALKAISPAHGGYDGEAGGTDGGHSQ